MKTLVILMAPPGAGKTELAEYLRSRHNNAIIVNKSNFVKEGLDSAERMYYHTIDRLLKENDAYVIVDSQAVLYQDRIELFKNLSLKDVKVIGVWIEVSRREANRRNDLKFKDMRADDKEMDFLFKYKISPMPEEPFNELIYIMRDADVAMSKSYPYLTTTLGVLDRI